MDAFKPLDDFHSFPPNLEPTGFDQFTTVPSELNQFPTVNPGLHPFLTAPAELNAFQTVTPGLNQFSSAPAGFNTFPNVNPKLNQLPMASLGTNPFPAPFPELNPLLTNAPEFYPFPTAAPEYEPFPSAFQEFNTLPTIFEGLYSFPTATGVPTIPVKPKQQRAATKDRKPRGFHTCNSWHTEIKVIISKLNQLDEDFQAANSEKEIWTKITEAAVIHSQIEDVTKGVDKLSAGEQKRNILRLLSQLKNLDDQTIIGMVMRMLVNGPDGKKTKYKAHKANNCLTRVAHTGNIYKAFKVACAELANNFERASEYQPATQQVESSSYQP